MKNILLFLFLSVSYVNFAQEETSDSSDVEAGFPGGTQALQRFISDNVKYPQEAIDSCEKGRVYISYVVEKDGSLTNIVIARGVSPLLDAEAIRVMKSMPKFIPGESNGKKVKTRCHLPITFVMDNCDEEDKDGPRKKKHRRRKE